MAATWRRCWPQHEFQEGFKNLRDLLFLERNLQPTGRQPRALRRHAGATAATPMPSGCRRFVHGRRRWTSMLLPPASARWPPSWRASRRRAMQRRWPTPGSANWCGRLARVQAAAERAGDGADAVELRERVRRVSGALAWQQAEQFPARLWQAKKAMREIDARLPQARARAEALAQAQIGEPASFDRLRCASAQLDRRIRPAAAEGDRARPRAAGRGAGNGRRGAAAAEGAAGAVLEPGPLRHRPTVRPGPVWAADSRNEVSP